MFIGHGWTRIDTDGERGQTLLAAAVFAIWLSVFIRVYPWLTQSVWTRIAKASARAAEKNSVGAYPSRDGERGQALFMLTISLVVMFGLVGLVVDVGWAYFRRQAAQAAAEAAALAAAHAALVNSGGTFACDFHGVACQTETCPETAPNPPADTLQNGCLYAAANDFPSKGRTLVTMAAGSGPSAPGVAGVAVKYWTRATAEERLPQFFSAVMGNDLLVVRARATAGAFSSGENACLYVLDPAAPGALTASGTTVIEATGCDVYVNSRSAQAMTVTGGATLNAGSIQLVGGYEKNGTTSVINPDPVQVGTPEQDPFADLPAPPVGPCTETNWSISGKREADLPEGVYCGGITIGGQSKVNFTGGTYVLNGGGLSVAAGAVASGAGVMFYNTGIGYAPGNIKIAGGSSVTLAAKDSGTYKGVLFYQDRNLTSPPSSDLTGGETMHLNGTVYIPNAGVKFAGGSSTDFTALVVQTVTYTGNSRFKADPTGEHTGLIRRTVALIE